MRAIRSSWRYVVRFGNTGDVKAITPFRTSVSPHDQPLSPFRESLCVPRLLLRLNICRHWQAETPRRTLTAPPSRAWVDSESPGRVQPLPRSSRSFRRKRPHRIASGTIRRNKSTRHAPVMEPTQPRAKQWSGTVPRPRYRVRRPSYGTWFQSWRTSCILCHSLGSSMTRRQTSGSPSISYVE